MIAVVGSQSTGITQLIQEKVLCYKVSLVKNFSQKARELSPADPLKFNLSKLKVKKSMRSLLIAKENIMKIWSNSKSKLKCKLKEYVEVTKESVIYL